MIKQKLSLGTSVFFVHGLHCASCELLIEKRILKEASVEEVNVSLSEGTVTIKHQPDDKITPEYFNEIFKNDGYQFSTYPFKNKETTGNDICLADDTNHDINISPSNNQLTPYLIAGLFVLIYILLQQSGFSSLVSVNSKSSLPIFLMFGILAGFSSCAALVGGLILAISKQWLSLYKNTDSTLKKAEPHILFNIGRVLGYTGLGAMLGLVGNVFKISPAITATMVIAISTVMVLLGLQMIGIKALNNFHIRLPKSFIGKVADESNFQGRLGPMLMGALTFFLPCGFTITAQALALASGNPLQGALIMGLFALGTVPGLFVIGLSSVKLHSNPNSSKQFSLIAGLLVLFFAFININAQLSVLGVSNINDFISAPSKTQISPATGDLPPIINGKQVVKIDANSYSYTPNKIRLLANTPTRWEVTSSGISGCTNAIVSRGLFDGQIDLVNGQISVKEFISPKPGVYKFSCWMGMVTGTVEVVDAKGSTGAAINAQPAASGAKGCGCGGGTGSACGGIN